MTPSHLLVKNLDSGSWALWSLDGSAKANAFLQAAQAHQAVSHLSGAWTPIASSGHGWGCGNEPDGCDSLVYDKAAGFYILGDDAQRCNAAFSMGALLGPRPLKNLGGTASCIPNCNACEGDCDRHSDCAGELLCFFRDSSSQLVPGCSAGGAGDINTHDYCYDPQGEQ